MWEGRERRRWRQNTLLLRRLPFRNQRFQLIERRKLSFRALHNLSTCVTLGLDLPTQLSKRIRLIAGKALDQRNERCGKLS